MSSRVRTTPSIRRDSGRQPTPGSFVRWLYCPVSSDASVAVIEAPVKSRFSHHLVQLHRQSSHLCGRKKIQKMTEYGVRFGPKPFAIRHHRADLRTGKCERVHDALDARVGVWMRAWPWCRGRRIPHQSVCKVERRMRLLRAPRHPDRRSFLRRVVREQMEVGAVGAHHRDLAIRLKGDAEQQLHRFILEALR